MASVLVPVAVVLAGVLFAVGTLRESGHNHESGEKIRRKVGEVIPDLDFRTLEGKAIKLSELKSKIVVINFWATWCAPCVRELPSLQQLANEYSSQGLTVVGVNMDEDPNVVLAPFLAKHEVKFRSFIDPKGELADRFGISGLPLTLVVDGNRKLLYDHLGDEEWFAPEYRKQFELWLTGTNSG